MNKSFTLRRATLLLALTLPSFCWGFGPAPKNALIVNDGGANDAGFDTNTVQPFLSGRLENAGYTVITNTGVPGGSLAGYKQIWDIRYSTNTPLSGPDVTAYLTYLQGGGSLFVMGENSGFAIVRDNSIPPLITAAGGGSVAILQSSNSLNLQTVMAPFTGPVPLTTITYAAVGGFSAIGNGRFVTVDASNNAGAIVFPPGTLTNAALGTVIVVLDVNFLTASTVSSQPLTDNLIAYLAAPVYIPPVGATSYTMTGPAGGALNVASSNFSVTPNGPYTGTITITPSGGGVSTPIVLTFSNSSSAQTFTITPISIGPVVLTPSNNGSLTNAAALSYATPSSAPTIGAATVGAGSIAVAFTPPNNTGGSAISFYTATCSPGNASAMGASSPITVTGLTTASAYTCTVTATNAGGVSAASSASSPLVPGLPPTPAPSTVILVVTGLLFVAGARRKIKFHNRA